MNAKAEDLEGKSLNNWGNSQVFLNLKHKKVRKKKMDSLRTLKVKP